MNGSLPPLVEPGPELSSDAAARAQRQVILPGIGVQGQRRLRAARILLIGAGGLGTATAPYLAGAGVGTIGIVDDDVVELSNLHRQIAHGTPDLGRDKTASLADALTAIDPSVRVEQHRLRLDHANALELLAGYDLVIDGSDNFATRYLVADACEILDIPLVWGSILQFHGQVGLSWQRHGPGYRDLFPVPPNPGDVPDCGTGGVLPGLCGTIGSLLATETMKLVTGIGRPLLGRVLLYDALAAGTRELSYARDPERTPITGLDDAARPAPEPESIGPAALSAWLSAAPETVVLDVRTPEEYARRHLHGAVLLPLDDLEAGAAPPPGSLLVYCEHGIRSARAMHLLPPDTRAVHLAGGIADLAHHAPELIREGDR